jgi:hypothetical protein
VFRYEIIQGSKPNKRCLANWATVDYQQEELSFIVFQGIIKEKGLQALVQILYQILDKTRNVVV